jgi:hypothetical protein
MGAGEVGEQEDELKEIVQIFFFLLLTARQACSIF